MRLVTFAAHGLTRAGVIAGDNTVVAVADLVPGAPDDMIGLIERWPELQERLGAAVRHASDATPLAQVRLLAPIPRTPKNIICLGHNYKEHIIESQHAQSLEIRMPEYPVFFTKSPLSISAPDTDVEIDQAVTQKVDWEGELGIVIGKRGRDLPDSDVAYEYVFGYTAANDLSARDLQQRMQGSQQQWFKGKSLDGFCPLGPWIVTRDEIPDPHSLEIMTRVNGVTKQHSNTSDFLFRVPRILQDISAGMTLEPSDVILTGTPSGVGNARTPKEFLQPGDVVEVEIGEIGVLRNRIVARHGHDEMQVGSPTAAARAGSGGTSR